MSSLLSENFGYILVSSECQVKRDILMPQSISFQDIVEHFGKLTEASNMKGVITNILFIWFFVNLLTQ